MKFIAHRGLFEGPNKDKENHPDQIFLALDKKYDCEIDLWVKNNSLWLGHDEPQYLIDHEFLEVPELWIHCKNFEALFYCKNYQNLNYFWHENDSYTLTSKNYIWAYPGKIVNYQSVQVMPEMADPALKNIDWSAYAVCSDYVEKLKSIYQNQK